MLQNYTNAVFFQEMEEHNTPSNGIEGRKEGRKVQQKTLSKDETNAGRYISGRGEEKHKNNMT